VASSLLGSNTPAASAPDDRQIDAQRVQHTLNAGAESVVCAGVAAAAVRRHLPDGAAQFEIRRRAIAATNFACRAPIQRVIRAAHLWRARGGRRSCRRRRGAHERQDKEQRRCKISDSNGICGHGRNEA
jgi:hypothetical protein